jgi:hypothetical protein
MRRPQPAKLSDNANVDDTPSTGKPWQVSMLRCREKYHCLKRKHWATIVCGAFSAHLDMHQTASHVF